MAILNALLAFIGRTVGRILSALLDWAVVALFGRVAGRRKYVFLGLMAAAAAWPVLLFGVIWPKAVVFLIAFVPLSRSIPPNWIRPIWIGLALLVPVAVGLTLAVQAPPERRKGVLSGILRGFPITAGLAAAFLILLVTVPVLRIVSAVRGRQDTYVPLVTTDESYRVAADLVGDTLRRHDIESRRTEPPWWFGAPVSDSRAGGQERVRGLRRRGLAVYLRGPELEITLYPNALLLRGSPLMTARAHALVIEALTGEPDMFQTVTPRAQEIERQVQRVWAAYRVNPEAHENAPALLARLDEITLEMTQHPYPFEEWQVIYRQAVQLDRALTGHRQILEQTLPEETP